MNKKENLVMNEWKRELEFARDEKEVIENRFKQYAKLTKCYSWEDPEAIFKDIMLSSLDEEIKKKIIRDYTVFLQLEAREETLIKLFNDLENK